MQHFRGVTWDAKVNASQIQVRALLLNLSQGVHS